MSRFAFFPLAALLLFASSAQAQSAPAGVEAKHADLDFAKDSDAFTMIDRLVHAAASPCRNREGVDKNRCIAKVVANSVITLSAPTVTKAYTSRYGAAPEAVVGH